MGVEPTRDRAERPPSRFEDGETHRGPYTSIRDCSEPAPACQGVVSWAGVYERGPVQGPPPRNQVFVRGPAQIPVIWGGGISVPQLGHPPQRGGILALTQAWVPCF